MQTDERFLIAFAQSGDASAFWQLADPYVGRLRFWLQKRIPDLRNDAPFADAIEAMALEDARAGIKMFAFRASFSTWLHVVAYHRACQELARRGRDVPIDGRDFEAIALRTDRTDRSAADIVDEKAYRHDPERHHRDEPVRVLIRKQRKALEHEAVKRLTKGERAVYVRLRFRGMKYPDVARELGISQEAARRRMADAKSRVRAYVEAHESPRLLSNHLFTGGK